MRSLAATEPNFQALTRNMRAASCHGCRVEIWRGGMEVLRFQIPLIKPDGQISSIRLSDKVIYAFAHGRLVLKRSSRNRPSF